MSYFLLYIGFALLDLYTTARAFKYHQTAQESHPIWSRVFGNRLRDSQLLIALTCQICVITAFVFYTQAPIALFLFFAIPHLIASISNYIRTDLRRQ